jgi:hypothetical protein
MTQKARHEWGTRLFMNGALEDGAIDTFSWAIDLLKAGPDYAVEHLVHLLRRFFFAAIEPPAEEREQAAG